MDRATTLQPVKKSASAIQRSTLTVGIFLFILGSLLPFLATPHQRWFAALRWTGLIVIGLANPNRGSLTSWIFLSMLLGGEIGLDRPQFGEHLRGWRLHEVGVCAQTIGGINVPCLPRGSEPHNGDDRLPDD